MKQIAIIGSGPAGCYLADQLLGVIPESTVDVLERLPVPFGLVRYGVAPDHQGTKSVSRVLDRILSNPRIGFFGNVEVGRDIGLDELINMYDAVVLATGALQDRKLGIPGEDIPGVLGSAAFVTWYNAHPESLSPALHGLSSVVIIRNGNVAIDVARILARDPAELRGSDLPAEALSWLEEQPLRDIHIVGRRAPVDAKFNEYELAQLGTLSRAQPRIADPICLHGDEAVVRALREFNLAPSRSAHITIHFHFNMTPLRFCGSDHLRSVHFRCGDRDCELSAQLAVTCIGYEAASCCSEQPMDGVFANEGCKIRDKLYVVGWAKRGSYGTIPTNRTEAKQLAQRMAREVVDSALPGRVALTDRLRCKGIRFINHAGWKRIDAAETAFADRERCRRKFRSVAEMLHAASDSMTVHDV